ncbi:hypothetical protein ACHQM5_020269 [Ranunculus cassubicifolius]
MDSGRRNQVEGKSEYHHEEAYFTKSIDAQEPNSSKTYQPSEHGSKRLRIAGRQNIPMPLRNFEYKNSDNVIDHAFREERSEEMSPAVAHLCKLLGVHPSELKLNPPIELPWERKEAMIPSSGVPVSTGGVVFSEEHWYF